jgi:hypothetical protein
MYLVNHPIEGIVKTLPRLNNRRLKIGRNVGIPNFDIQRSHHGARLIGKLMHALKVFLNRHGKYLSLR